MFCFSMLLCSCCSQLCFECLQCLHGGEFFTNKVIQWKSLPCKRTLNLSCSVAFRGNREFSLFTVSLIHSCSISESFLTVKGAALFLPRGNGSSTPRISHRRNKHAGNVLDVMAEACLLTLVSKFTFLEFTPTK